jgi:hypothetical protein
VGYDWELGRPFHGEFTSADASGLSEVNSRFTLYKASSTTSITLASNERVVITDLEINNVTAGVAVSVYDGADATVDVGERISKHTLAANSSMYLDYLTPHYCQTASYPKVKTSGAGQVDVTIRGVIVRDGQ